MKPETALYQLRTMPQAFLENNLVVIAGKSTSGVFQFSFGAHKNPPTGPGAPNEAFMFSEHPFVMDTPASVRVHNVRMVPNTEEFDAGSIPAYSLGGGPDIMVTGQLSGCTFCVFGQPASPVVAHIQPRPKEGLDAAALRTKLRDEGKFTGHDGGVSQIFGVPDYPAYAYVVGVKVAGAWQIYGQQVSTPGNAARITGVTRIL